MNIEINERIAFNLINDRGIPKDKTSPCARPFLVRDAQTRAWDGSHIYIYINE